MNDIFKKIRDRKDQVEFLFQQYQISEPVSPDSVQRAGQKYGYRFLTDLAAILNRPPMQANSIGMFMPLSAGADPALGSPAVQTTVTDTNAATGWGGWDFLSNLVSTGYQVFTDIKGRPVIMQPSQPPAENIAGIPAKTLLIGAGALIVFLIVFLIVKK